jgi:diguanylate cyclase (GGDEF)-like protein
LPIAPSATPADPWADIQESLSRYANLALGRYKRPDGRGNFPICNDNPVCKIMRAHPEAGERCVGQCDQGIKQSMASGRTQLFTCHARLSVFIAPYDVTDSRGQSVSEAILGGKAFLDYDEIEKFRHYATALGIDEDTLATLIPGLRVTPLSGIKSFLEHARTVSESFAQAGHQLDQGGRQAERVRHLSEVIATLDTEKPSELPLAVLHGLGILFNLCAGLLLTQADKDGPLHVSDAYNGHSAGFSDDELRQTTIDPSVPWVSQVLGGDRNTLHDAVGEILKAGFPANTSQVALFRVSRSPQSVTLAILNTDLTAEDQGAIGMFCRYAGLLIEKEALRTSGMELPEQSVEHSPVWNTDNLDELADELLLQASAAVGAERCSVMLVEPDGKQLRVRAIRGLNLKYVEYVRIQRGESISGSVWAEAKPMLVEDIRLNADFSGQRRSRYAGNSFLSIPLMLADQVYGVINVSDKRGNGVFTPTDLRRLTPLAQQAALAIDRIEAKHTTEVLRRASMTDYLTDLLNRGAFDQRLSEEVERARRYPYANPLSLLVVDIDDFKKVNDAYGLLTGDDCIRACAQTLKQGTRNIDSVYRRGGEEFTVLLPHTNRDAAMILAERLCRAMAATQVVTKNTPEPVSFTISIGLSTFPEDGDSDDTLFARANQALHVAKGSGKNQVVTLPPPESA